MVPYGPGGAAHAWEPIEARPPVVPLTAHPVWPWISRVRGVSAAVVAQLLERLDPTRAPTPSSFWSYCGLATVEGDSYRCASCGARITLASGRRPRAGAPHRAREGSACTGALDPDHGEEAGAGASRSRVAQPRPTPGARAAYDRDAKQLCYQLGMSLTKHGGAYARLYQEQRRRLDETRATWPERRRHLTALRMTEKMFLAHLWLVWREALGLPVTRPYAEGDRKPVGPWEMVG